MGKLIKEYAKLFEAESNWKDAFPQISLEGAEKHGIVVDMCEGREWCIEIHSTDADVVDDFLDAVNEKLHHEFKIEEKKSETFVAICEKHINESEEEEEEEDIPVELEVIEEEPEMGDEDSEMGELIMDSPAEAGVEDDFGSMDDFDTYKEKKDLSAAMNSDTDMAVSQLSNIKSHIDEIIDTLSQYEELPAWIQQKITIATSHLDEVYHRIKH